MRVRSHAVILWCGLLSGAVVTAVTLPAVAFAGLAAKSASDEFQTLPRELRTPRPPQVTLVYAGDGKTLITTFYDQYRQDVPLDQVTPVMRQAMVAAEDVRYYQHGGVDFRSVVRALVSNQGGANAQQGASTLTMQYVRNVLKNDPGRTAQERLDATVDTAARKLQEMRYANALEGKLSKDEILNRYLNIAYFGAGAYGVYAAGQKYFGKPASQLTLAEAALLAGLVQAPDTYNPIDGDMAGALNRRAYVLEAMTGAGMISESEADAARTRPVVLTTRQLPNNCAAVAPEHNDWGFFCDYVRRWWHAQPQFGETWQDRENSLKQGGYKVVTSLDPGVQAAALQQSLAVYGYDRPRTLPIAVVTPGTGRVLALAVNRRYSLAPNPDLEARYPNTVNQLVTGGGGVHGYQAGSTFKMFTMLAALEAGLPLNTSFNSPSQLVTSWPASGPGSCGGMWCPANANPKWMNGVRTMWNGFGRSVNTYFVWLEQQVGPQQVVAMAGRLGIKFRSPTDVALAEQPGFWGSFTLGTAETTPLELANAYATLAANGVYCPPLPVLSITDASGAKVPAGNPSCRQALDPDVAAAATDAARCPVGQQSAYGRCDGGTAEEVSAILAGRPVAGKTGSSEYNVTETFVGFTPQLAAAAIAANPDSPDSVGAGVSSAVNAAVARTMAATLSGKPVQGFRTPSRRIALGG